MITTHITTGLARDAVMPSDASTQPRQADVVGRLWVVAKGHPQADDAGPGDHNKPFRTINAAAGQAQPGDRIVVFAGIYRERVAPVRGGEPGRPIVYEAASDCGGGQ